MLGLGLALRQRDATGLRALFAGGVAGAWYDPSDLATLFADSSGTVPAALDGPVGRVADKSGRGNHAVQAVAAARPTLRRDSGGRLYLAFDGVDDCLIAAAIGAPSGGWTAIAGLRHVGGAYANIWSNRDSSTTGLRLDTGATGVPMVVAGNGTALISSSVSGSSIAANAVAAGRYDASGVTAFHNSVAAAPAAVTLAGGAAGWALGRAQEFAGNPFRRAGLRVAVGAPGAGRWRAQAGRAPYRGARGGRPLARLRRSGGGASGRGGGRPKAAGTARRRQRRTG